MNTPKEEAQRLVNQFIEPTKAWDEFHGWVDDMFSAKQCAKICVQEILNAVTTIADKKYDFYKEVLKEIDSL